MKKAAGTAYCVVTFAWSLQNGTAIGRESRLVSVWGVLLIRFGNFFGGDENVLELDRIDV